MSIASSSSSAASALRTKAPVRPQRVLASGSTPPPRRPRATPPPQVARPYTPAPAFVEPDDPIDDPADQRPYTPPRSSTSPEAAQAYLANLLHLPPSRAFSPALALQILTHKSYRYVHLIRRPAPTTPYPPTSSFPLSPNPSPSQQQSQNSELDEWAANHNARLSFLGRRALASYLAMFVHSSIASSSELRNLDFLRGRSLDMKLEAMRVDKNIGKEVGTPWRVGEVMRWDRNETGEATGAAKIKGMTVEAIMGAVFSQFGSPAAHRTFHLHVLPHLSRQLRDPRLMERVESMRDRLRGEFGGGILPR